jgi:hypothetical protein
MSDYRKEQMEYIDSVDGNAHLDAVLIIGRVCTERDNLSGYIIKLHRLIERLCPKHQHDHDYWHDDCGLCQMEKQQYDLVQKEML